jgi:hypothetical protein
MSTLCNTVTNPSAAPGNADAHAHLAFTDVAGFTHTVQTKANSIRFAHQLLCSPRISSFNQSNPPRFSPGVPNLTAKNVTKYLNPSPSTTKGHMKCPRKGIRSTRRNAPVPHTNPFQILNNDDNKIEEAPNDNINDEEDDDLDELIDRPHIIMDDYSDTNMFCFAVFADKHTGTIYNNLTGVFPFMSLKGNVCFLVVYHYESNAILATPIASFSNNAILAAY